MRNWAAMKRWALVMCWAALAACAAGADHHEPGPPPAETTDPCVAEPEACEEPPETCEAGWLDCDGDGDNGCEIDQLTDAEHCGSCGNACAAEMAFVACEAGACKLAGCYGDDDAPPRFGDCNHFYDDGCERDLRTDALHCGRCDHACPATACDGGLCAPIDVVPLVEVVSLGVDEDTLWWSWLTRIHSAPKLGGSVLNGSSFTGAAPLQMIIDATHVFYGKNGTVRRVGKDGFGNLALFQGDAFVEALAQDGTHVYFTVRLHNDPPMDTQIWRSNKQDGTAEQLAALTARRPYRIAVGGDWVFWTDSAHDQIQSSVMRVSKLGGPATKIYSVAAADAYREIEADGERILWLSSVEGLVAGTHDGGTADGLVDPDVVVATGGLLLDGSDVFFVSRRVDGNSVVTQLALDGTSDGPREIAFGGPKVLAVDEHWLYWPGGTLNTIVKAPRL